MDYIDQFITNIKNISDEQNKLFSVEKKEIIFVPKEINTETVDFRNIKSKMIKRGLIDRMKPGNIGSKEYHSNNTVDILEDDIFKNNTNTEEKDEEKINIHELPFEKKLELINDFLDRKNITLDSNNNAKLINILQDESILLKKYINISNMYQHITKITFVKKLEDGSYIIDLDHNKNKKAKNHFFK
jgi:hypothetical protein